MGLRVRVPHQLPFLVGGKMKTLLKYIFMPVAAYFGFGWAADNPMKTKFLLNKVDNRVEQGYEFALFQFKSFSSEPVLSSTPEPKRKNKKEKK